MEAVIGTGSVKTLMSADGTLPTALSDVKFLRGLLYIFSDRTVAIMPI